MTRGQRMQSIVIIALLVAGTTAAILKSSHKTTEAAPLPTPSLTASVPVESIFPTPSIPDSPEPSAAGTTTPAGKPRTTHPKGPMSDTGVAGSPFGAVLIALAGLLWARTLRKRTVE